MSRYNNYLAPFKQQLEEFKKFIPQKGKRKAKKKIVYNNARKLYNILLSIYHNDYNNDEEEERKITDEEKERMDKKYDPESLLIKCQRFTG